MNDVCEQCGVIPYDADLHAEWHQRLNAFVHDVLDFQESSVQYAREVAEALQRIEARPL